MTTPLGRTSTVLAGLLAGLLAGAFYFTSTCIHPLSITRRSSRTPASSVAASTYHRAPAHPCPPITAGDASSGTPMMGATPCTPSNTGSIASTPTSTAVSPIVIVLTIHH